MKILLIVHQFLPKYSSGTEILTFETAKELISRGHEVRIISAEPASLEAAKDNPIYEDKYDGIKIYRINYNLGIYENPVRAEYCNKIIYELIANNVLNKFTPDIVHIMHCSRLSAEIINVFKEHMIPTVITATDFWFICPLSQLRLPDNMTCKGPSINSTNCLKCYVSKTQPKEFIDRINLVPNYLLTAINGVCKLKFVEKWEKGIMVRALVRRKKYMIKQINKLDKIIVPTKIMASLLSENNVDNKKFYTSSFGLNNKYLNREFTVKSNKGVIRFGFMGTLYEHKGPHLLIKAFTELEKKYKNIELSIYGDLNAFPDYVTQLKKLSGQSEKIKFMGTFPNCKIGQVFENIDVLVVPSIWYENTPLVIYSAFSTKTPVIATNLEGMTEVVKHNVNGLVFEKENVKDLKNQMEKFLSNKNLLKDLSSKIDPVKSIEENVDEYEKIYKGLLR